MCITAMDGTRSSTTLIWHCQRAKSWPWSATTDQASPPCSRSWPATTGLHAESCGSGVQPIVLDSPGEARALGIEPVYQDLAILDDLNLWRNFFLGKERRRGLFGLGVLAQGWMREECAVRLHEVGLTRVTSVDRPARELSGGERQSLAVMRAVYFGISMLLLDEPTASRSTRETSHVLAAIVESRNRGLGILYIDHNVSHVLRIADRIVVLEHGRLIKQLKGADVTENDVSSLLVSS